jgi:hypothetical protein
VVVIGGQIGGRPVPGAYRVCAAALMLKVRRTRALRKRGGGGRAQQVVEQQVLNRINLDERCAPTQLTIPKGFLDVSGTANQIGPMMVHRRLTGGDHGPTSPL